MTSVLVIDDHPIVLQGCRRVLEAAGIRYVLEARDAVSGYKLFRRHPGPMSSSSTWRWTAAAWPAWR
jgi:DNA-binding NarL/FixJ family response regulator